MMSTALLADRLTAQTDFDPGSLGNALGSNGRRPTRASMSRGVRDRRLTAERRRVQPDEEV